MFERIMVPTDGSVASTNAIDAAVAFAHGTGAQVVGLHVIPLRPLYSHLLGVLATPENEALANEYLDYVKRRAAQAGVPATVLTRTSDTPYDAIVTAARDQQCDLIVMGKHGRSGVRALLLGSQTQAVLTHSAIPVLVIPQSGTSAPSTT
jgi:nucleotide-binding universal stress UspA family protein